MGDDATVHGDPTAGVSFRYGHGLLPAASSDWPRYVVVTSPSAHRTAFPFLEAVAEARFEPTSLDADHLRRATEGLPRNVALTVGLGGGLAIDAAKYVAVALDTPLVIIPTIVSTAAFVHRYCGTYHGRTLVGGREDWVWAERMDVLIDFDVVLRAPMHLNTAGLGDILCEQSGLAEWRRAHRDEPGLVEGGESIRALSAFHRQVVDGFSRTLGPNRELTATSIRFIVETLRQRDRHRVSIATAPNVDHLFLSSLEEVSNTRHVHGEIVALGALIVCWACDPEPELLAEMLDTCCVRWRPSDLGIGSDLMQASLSHLSETLGGLVGSTDYRSVLRTDPIRGETFARLWRFLGGS